MKGNIQTVGNCEDKFTMQSISKVIALILALEQNGFDNVFSKVGLEPTGDSFNSTVRLDHLTNNKPFNPMINAGAIAVTSTIRGGSLEERKKISIEFARKITGNPDLDVDYEVFRSEAETGFKNRAIIYLMRSNGIIEGSCEEHLELYFLFCSLACSCRDLSVFAATLANNGVNPLRVHAPHGKAGSLSWSPAACMTTPASLPPRWAFPPRAVWAAGSSPAPSGSTGLLLTDPLWTTRGTASAG